MTNGFLSERALSLNENELIEEVARQSIGTAYARDLVASGTIDPGQGIGFESLSDLRALGAKIFSRFCHEMYDLFCGGKEKSETERAELFDALGASDLVGLAFLTNFVSTHFSMSAALSAALSALLLKRIIKPAGAELCSFWRGKI